MTKLEQEQLNIYSNHQTLEHQSAMSRLIQAEEFNLFALLKPRLFIDGDKWCCLYGENIQEGVVGFGDTPYRAVLAWNQDWHEQLAAGQYSVQLNPPEPSWTKVTDDPSTLPTSIPEGHILLAVYLRSDYRQATVYFSGDVADAFDSLEPGDRWIILLDNSQNNK